MFSGAETYIEDCFVSNAANEGIRVDGGQITHISRTESRSNGTWGLITEVNTIVHLSDSRIVENGKFNIFAVFKGGIFTPGGTLIGTRVAVDHNAGDGILMSPRGHATFTDSSANDNSSCGFGAIASQTGASVEASLIRFSATRNLSCGVVSGGIDATTSASTVVTSSAITDNWQGVIAGAWGVLRLSDSTVANNRMEDLNATGTLLTSGNNTLTGRGAADIVGILDPNPLK